VTNLVFKGEQWVNGVDTMVVPRVVDDVVRSDNELVTEASETGVFLVAVAIDEVEVEVDLIVDPSLVEETTVLVAVTFNEVDEEHLVVELPLLPEVPFLSLFIRPDAAVVVALADEDIERADDELVMVAFDKVDFVVGLPLWLGPIL
jgi:hypothetical protein